MTPREILEGCQRDGVALTVTEERNLAFEGDSYALSYWLPILRKYKNEVVDALDPLPKSCRECRHFASPGLSAGYCGQRSDLRVAYGINHPLRRLPADNGESCHEYDAEDWVRHER